MSAETFKQIDQQLANEQQGATVLVENNGQIVTGQIYGYAENGSRVFFTGSNDSVGERAMRTQSVTAEALSDGHQAALAEKLAGTALRGTEVDVTTDKQPFNPEVANLERSIREAHAEKHRAQQEGRGEDSIYWGQVAGQYSRELNQKRS